MEERTLPSMGVVWDGQCSSPEFCFENGSFYALLTEPKVCNVSLQNYYGKRSPTRSFIHNLYLFTICSILFFQTHCKNSPVKFTSGVKLTRKLCYRKDDRAMRAIYVDREPLRRYTTVCGDMDI